MEERCRPDYRLYHNVCKHFVRAGKDNQKMLREHLDAGMDIDALGEFGQTALMYAIEGGNVGNIRFLLERGADVDTYGYSKHEHLTYYHSCDEFKGRTTAIHVFAEEYGAFKSEENAKQVFHLLLNAGADVNARDEEGRTPIWLTMRNGFPAATKLLLEAGADRSIPDNKHNITPLKGALWLEKYNTPCNYKDHHKNITLLRSRKYARTRRV